MVVSLAVKYSHQLQQWLGQDPDPETRHELRVLVERGEDHLLEKIFERRLEFGTAGLRGLVGPGPSRMNILVVRQTSAGLGSYLQDAVPNSAERGILIAYDGRHHSKQFAIESACVFVSMGFKVYLTANSTPTPIAAYGVSQFGTAAGVVVTASHNPKEYNGYKVFWQNGAQIIPPHDSAIADRIASAAESEVATCFYPEAVATGKIQLLVDELSTQYILAVLRQFRSSAFSSLEHTSVAYTALHGVGATTAEALLRRAGIGEFYGVLAQNRPDGDFPTVDFPNPEEPGAMDEVLSLASNKGADIACANDPDADRLAVAIRTPEGSYRMLSGDQIGVLLGDHVLRKKSGESRQSIVCNSIVSSRMLEKICEHYGALHFTTLTGFKWIANVGMDHETPEREVAFGYEEALGYCVGNLVRDKDGLSALLLFAELAAELKREGLTVMDRLESLHRKFGLFVTAQRSTPTDKLEQNIMAELRTTPPMKIGDFDVENIEDLKVRKRVYPDGRSVGLSLPSSDVFIVNLSHGARVVVRPSGTEPKLKCYYEMKFDIGAKESYADTVALAERSLSTLATTHQATFING